MIESSRGMNPAAAGRIGKVVPPKLAPPDPFGKSHATEPGRSLGDRIVGPTAAGFFPLGRIVVACPCRRCVGRSATGSASKRPRNGCCVSS